MIHVRLLGRFAVHHDGDPVEIPSRPAQSLLAFLALNPDVAHRRERLSGLLWPDADETNARSNLRHALWRIRQALSAGSGKEPDFLLSDNISLTFRATPEVWVDALQVGRASPPEESLDNLLADVSACGGELLPGFYDEWVILERERLRACFERKIQDLLSRLLAAERWREVLEWGERWIALGQVPEPAFRALMQAHAGLGDRAGVAAVFRRCSEALERELGVEPSAQTLETYQRLSAPQTRREVRRDLPAPVEGSSASQAIEALLFNWRHEGVSTLDVAALATVYAAPVDLALGPDDIRLCLRSAVHHGLDLRPWLQRSRLEDVVIALDECYRDYPKPRGRAAIVDILWEIGGPEAASALMNVAQTEESSAIRATAALALARGGMLREVVERLLAAHQSTNDPSALAALVAVADEVGLPADVGPLPRLPLALGIAQRRWREGRAKVFAQATRAAVGGAVALMVHGAGTPAYMALGRPEVFATAQDFITIPGWMISAAVTGLVVGALQGAALGLSVGLADAMWHGPRRRLWRPVMGALAGLIQPAYQIPFSLAGLLGPVAGPQVYVPINILYGLILGSVISLGLPRLGARPPWRTHIGKPLLSALALGIATVPYVLLLYRELAGASMLSRILFASILSIGIGMSQCRWRRTTPATSEGQEATDLRMMRPVSS
jgi:DNA-binding SARP family transcriptional activator